MNALETSTRCEKLCVNSRNKSVNKMLRSIATKLVSIYFLACVSNNTKKGNKIVSNSIRVFISFRNDFNK